MKYDADHAPLACMLTESACYKGTRPMTVKGVLWHSTGANNPNLSRYVQPADNDIHRDEQLTLIGTNKYGNDYNHGSKDRQMGVNAWIGKLADGTVATVQTMPWGWKPWGCGAGPKGSCNDGFVQFECAEDSLTDPEYAWQVYNEACELTAYLCKMYHLDPKGTVQFKGVTVPVILDHRTSHQLGLGNNHGDVQHWFPKVIGKTLDDIRNDVAALMDDVVVETKFISRGIQGEEVKALQKKLMALGYDLGKWGADGDFGAATENAVCSFQKDHGLDVTGMMTVKDLAVLDEAIINKDKTYTVTIHGLMKAEADAMKTRWPDCEVIQE